MIRVHQEPTEALQKQPRARKVKLVSGGERAHRGGRLYVCAYGWKDACELVNESRKLAKGCAGNSTVGYMRNYWHAGCWGNSMEGVKPERGVWHTPDPYTKSPKITRLI